MIQVLLASELHKTFITDRIANPECKLGAEVARILSFKDKDAMDLEQADPDMLTAALKRMVVLRALERADVAEVLKDPWFGVGSGAGDSSGDEVALPTGNCDLNAQISVAGLSLSAL